MNANELANLIGMCGDGGYNQDAATMLRQQQAEIEALKAGKIRAYDNGVEDGRKPDTNNEPVAWAVWEGRPHDLFFYKEEADELCRLKGGDAKTVPLYTHPVKELPNNHQYIAQLEMTVRNQQAEIDRLTMLCDCMTTESNRKGNEIEALNELNTMLKDAIEKRIEMDANRYQWLRAEFAAGRETYLAEGIPSGESLDKYIDGKLK